MDYDVRHLLNHGAQNGTGLSRSGLTSAEYHGIVTSLDLYPILLLIWPKICISLFGTQLVCWLILKLWSTHTHEFPCSTMKPVRPYSVLTLLFFFFFKEKKENPRHRILNVEIFNSITLDPNDNNPSIYWYFRARVLVLLPQGEYLSAGIRAELVSTLAWRDLIRVRTLLSTCLDKLVSLNLSNCKLGTNVNGPFLTEDLQQWVRCLQSSKSELLRGRGNFCIRLSAAFRRFDYPDRYTLQ